MPSAWAQEILNIDASLANRLGIWQMKWEMEDLAFRVLSPVVYRDIANMLDDEEAWQIAKHVETKPDVSEVKATSPEIVLRHSSCKSGQGGDVLVVGVDSLLMQLARCCRPVPPDAIAGFVTRGKSVSIHRFSHGAD